jgi:hypothetical protein
MVLAREAFTDGLRSVNTVVLPGTDVAAWPPVPAEAGVVMFDPPRLFYDRERALWTPQPQELVAVARWMRAGGVRTLAVVLPHAQGRLPEALKRGLAGLDEQAVAALGFERVIFVRSAQKPGLESGRWVCHNAWHAGCCQSSSTWCPAASSRCVPSRWLSWWTWRCNWRRQASTWRRPSWCGGPRKRTCAHGAAVAARLPLAKSAQLRLACRTMPKAQLQAAALGGTADDIEAVASTRRCRGADIDKLMACWADEDEIVCVHPGGARRGGRGAIRATFEAMFANGSISAARARAQGRVACQRRSQRAGTHRSA